MKVFEEEKVPPFTPGPGPSNPNSDSNPHQAEPQAQSEALSSSSNSKVEPKKERQFNTAWKVNRAWLKYEELSDVDASNKLLGRSLTIG